MQKASRLTFENVATGVLVVCALAMTGMTASARLRKPPAPGEPVEVRNWNEYATGKMRLGPERAPVSLVVFSDFQCPFCAQLQVTLDGVMKRFPDDVKVVFRNYPLPQLHPFAVAAGRAAECAAGAGRFKEFHDFVFQHQDSIPGLDWTTTASAVGVSDTIAFDLCMEADSTARAMSVDSTHAAQLRIGGTPTVLVNRWKIEGAPTASQLDSLIRRELRRVR